MFLICEKPSFLTRQISPGRRNCFSSMVRKNDTEPRRRPLQERSRKRIATILDAAAELVREKGADGLVISEVAERAEVPIGSVYQYFPGKAAIVRALAESHLEQLRALLVRDIGSFVASKPTKRRLGEAVDLLVDGYYEFYANEPTFRAIWGGVQADPVLRELDVKDTQQNARIIQRALKPYFANTPSEELYGSCLLICDCTASALRLALEPGTSTAAARSIVKELKAMLTMHLRSKFSLR